MTSQIYYCSSIQVDVNKYNYIKGEKIENIWVPKHGKFLSQLGLNDEILLTIKATDFITDEGENNLRVRINGIIENVQALSPLSIDKVVEDDESDIDEYLSGLVKWGFEQKFKSVLIKYFDMYPDIRKYIGTLSYKYCTDATYSDLIVFLIKRYKYDITKDNHSLFEMAAMSKNVTLCELLLDECDAKIPGNVYNAFKAFGTKRFQYMWEVLKRYPDRVLLS